MWAACVRFAGSKWPVSLRFEAQNNIKLHGDMNMILRPTFTLLTLSPTVEGKSHAEVEEKNKSGLT